MKIYFVGTCSISALKSQYFFSKKPMRCVGKVTALHSFTQRIVFANAPRCVFSLTVHRSLPHNNVPSAACPAASTLICVVRALLYNVIVAFPSLSSIRFGFQYSVRR